jgi:hypothetical protein
MTLLMNFWVIAFGVFAALVFDAYAFVNETVVIYYSNIECPRGAPHVEECIDPSDLLSMALANLAVDPLTLIINFVLLFPLILRIAVWALRNR